MLYGKILRSQHPHAKVIKVDMARAAAHPGIKAVFDFEKQTVRYAGEEVAAVAAVSPQAAEEALKLIDVTYETLPFSVREEASMAEGAAVSDEDGSYLPSVRRWARSGSLLSRYGRSLRGARA